MPVVKLVDGLALDVQALRYLGCSDELIHVGADDSRRHTSKGD